MHRRRAASRASPAPSLLTATLAVISLVLAVLAPGAATAQAVPQRIITIRDAETEHLIRRFSTPLFRTAGVDPALVRVTVIQNRAINAFVSTGNLLFIHAGLIRSAALAPYAQAARLAPQEGLIRLYHARVLIELGSPQQLRQAVSELEAAMRTERDSAFAWRQMATARAADLANAADNAPARSRN